VDKVEQNDRIMKGEVYGTDWEPFFFFDGYHPNRNGHHALADLLIYLIQQQENDSYDEGNTTCRYGLRGSPPMLIVGNRDAWQCGCLLNPNLFSTFDLPEAEEEPAHAGFTYMAHLPDRALPRDQVRVLYAFLNSFLLSVCVCVCLCVSLCLFVFMHASLFVCGR
jgi:hypothetical protein